jgi:hypothetical protein
MVKLCSLSVRQRQHIGFDALPQRVDQLDLLLY